MEGGVEIVPASKARQGACTHSARVRSPASTARFSRSSLGAQRRGTGTVAVAAGVLRLRLLSEAKLAEWGRSY